MTNQFKNPWFYVLIAMVAGIVILGFGIDAFDSQILAKANKAPFMTAIGGILFVGSFILLATKVWGKK